MLTQETESKVVCNALLKVGKIILTIVKSMRSRKKTQAIKMAMQYLYCRRFIAKIVHFMRLYCTIVYLRYMDFQAIFGYSTDTGCEFLDQD